MSLAYRERGASGAQFDILCGTLVIGTLWNSVRAVKAGSATDWQWTFHLTAVPPGFQHRGSAQSLADAKGKVAEQWGAWLQAAGLEERA